MQPRSLSERCSCLSCESSLGPGGDGESHNLDASGPWPSVPAIAASEAVVRAEFEVSLSSKQNRVVPRFGHCAGWIKSRQVRSLKTATIGASGGSINDSADHYHLRQTPVGSARSAVARECLTDIGGGVQGRLGGVGFVIIRDPSWLVCSGSSHSPTSYTFIPSLISLYLFFSPHSFAILISRDIFPTLFVMNPVQIYTVAAGGTFSLFALVHLLPYVILFFTRVSLLISKHLTYPYALYRHHILGL
jgi:hypothetical protein